MIPIMSMEPHTHSHTHRHNAHNPSITISSFEVSGNHKTQLALFENEFAQSCKAKKFHELEGELSVALQRMREMDLFSSVDTQVRVLTPEKERASGSGDTKIAVLVVVKEKNMPSLKVIQLCIITLLLLCRHFMAPMPQLYHYYMHHP